MQVIINGFENSGAAANRQESYRDIFARTVAQANQRFGIRASAQRVTIQFADPSGSESLMNSEHQAASANGQPRQSGAHGIFDELLVLPQKNALKLRLHEKTMQAIQIALSRMNSHETVYVKWGLTEIDPFPRLSLNFSGQPGTGKTLAAHFIAETLGKRILQVSYANVVSKYFGEGAKNLVELFDFASRNNAILFIDEAETLLSKRSSNMEGADHAMNSMRSQLLILLERTPIISIFASNLVSSYDAAFVSRLITVEFARPDHDTRCRIWCAHLPTSMPLDSDVSIDYLATTYDELNGRQIARAVVEAAFAAAAENRASVARRDFDWAASFISNAPSRETSESASSS